MKCERCLARLPEYVGRSVDDATRRAIESHLASCVDCRRELGEWRTLQTAIERVDMARASTIPSYVAPSATAHKPLMDVPHSTAAYWRRVAPALALAAAAIVVFWIARPGLIRKLTPARTEVAERSSATPSDSGSYDRATGIPRRPTVVARSTFSNGLLTPERIRETRQADAAGVDRPTASPPSLALVDRLIASPTAPPTPPAAASPPPIEPRDTASPPDPPPAATAPPEESPTAPPTTIPTLPAPTATGAPITTGIVAGNVVGPDGLPRAEIWVVAERAVGDGVEARTFTGVDGRYRLELDPGEWIIHTESAFLPMMWHAGWPSPIGATRAIVAAGAEHNVSFHLESRPGGTISGVVTAAGGAPFDRALVVAAYPPGAPGEPPRPAAAGFTGSDGRFEIPIPPGVWVVGAAPDPLGERLTWLGGESPGAAERFVVRAHEAGPTLELRLDP